jgi:hypothetical protein
VTKTVEPHQFGQLVGDTVAPGGATGWKLATEQRDLFLNTGNSIVFLLEERDEVGRLGVCLQLRQQIA